eukprot:1160683-Pelagomonas_calceolata.AAC.3
MKRTDLGISAFENNMLLILHTILGITKITGIETVSCYAACLTLRAWTQRRIWAMLRTTCPVLSMMRGKSPPVCQLIGPEIHYKLTQI